MSHSDRSWCILEPHIGGCTYPTTCTHRAGGAPPSNLNGRCGGWRWGLPGFFQAPPLPPPSLLCRSCGCCCSCCSWFHCCCCCCCCCCFSAPTARGHAESTISGVRRARGRRSRAARRSSPTAPASCHKSHTKPHEAVRSGTQATRGISDEHEHAHSEGGAAERRGGGAAGRRSGL